MFMTPYDPRRPPAKVCASILKAAAEKASSELPLPTLSFSLCCTHVSSSLILLIHPAHTAAHTARH